MPSPPPIWYRSAAAKSRPHGRAASEMARAARVREAINHVATAAAIFLSGGCSGRHCGGSGVARPHCSRPSRAIVLLEDDSLESRLEELAVRLDEWAPRLPFLTHRPAGCIASIVRVSHSLLAVAGDDNLRRQLLRQLSRWCKQLAGLFVLVEWSLLRIRARLRIFFRIGLPLRVRRGGFLIEPTYLFNVSLTLHLFNWRDEWSSWGSCRWHCSEGPLHELNADWDR